MSILKLAKDEPILHELINKDARIPSKMGKKLLRKLQNDGLLYLKKEYVEVDSIQRLKLAVRAMKLGADVENISGLLRWQEFENMAAIGLERNGYDVTKNLRFKHAERRWEIDIVACKKPLALCVDCKRWHRGMHPSSLRKIVAEQVERTRALSEVLPSLAKKIDCASWNYAKLVPAVLSLIVGRLKFEDDVPIVPILQLQDFLNELPAHVDSLKRFVKT
jgi:Holliday junction resolvase-like predicted endonuclease